VTVAKATGGDEKLALPVSPMTVPSANFARPLASSDLNSSEMDAFFVGAFIDIPTRAEAAWLFKPAITRIRMASLQTPPLLPPMGVGCGSSTTAPTGRTGSCGLSVFLDDRPSPSARPAS
jgi:hypothetical protein